MKKSPRRKLVYLLLPALIATPLVAEYIDSHRLSLILKGIKLSNSFKAQPSPKMVTLPTLPPQPEIPPYLSKTKTLVLDDKSGSRSGILSQLTSESFQPLMDILSTNGGELAIGQICDANNKPLTRLRIEPPLTPKLEAPVAPESPDENQNVFLLRKAQQAYVQEMAEFEVRKTHYNQRLAKQKQVLATHERQARVQIEAFTKKELTPQLESPPTCQETDLWGALARASLFFQEDTSSWPTPPHLFLIVVSDGMDTVGNKFVTFGSDVQILLVNGSTTPGIFADIDHLPFESFDAAIAHITAIGQ